jgi:hypothetical protein
MERTASTDERLDRLADRIDARFERLEARMDAGFARLDEDIRELRGVLHRFGGGVMIALLAVIVTLIGLVGAILSTQ